MPHALIRNNRDIRAEADFTATNHVRFCAVHPSQERTVVRIRRPTGTGASPLPGNHENRNKQKSTALAVGTAGGEC